MRLARTLGIDQQEIKVIKKNNENDVHEQCTEMLNSYHRKKGSKFTKLKLIEALHQSDLSSVAEIIDHLNISGSADDSEAVIGKQLHNRQVSIHCKVQSLNTYFILISFR